MLSVPTLLVPAGVYNKDADLCLEALTTMGVYLPGGDRTAVRRTAEFFLKGFQVRVHVCVIYMRIIQCLQRVYCLTHGCLHCERTPLLLLGRGTMA